MREDLLNWAEQAADKLFNLRTYPLLQNKKIPLVIAHRGAWSGANTPENTMAAFQQARQLGMGGIELDIHFTVDGVPVIHHDPDLMRMHGVPKVIAQSRYSELQVLGLASLEEVLTLKDLHFMFEVKSPLTAAQLKTLAERLVGLRAVRDFHLLVLDAGLVRETSAFPAACWILVGQLKLRHLVELSLAHGYGGVAGHYLGMTNALIERLHDFQQMAGSGFISSRNILNRETARGIDWAFTNTAERLARE